ncbi:MAG: alpha/beta hydrolase family protein, partial [Solirubrobacteraceae bacterium]
PAPAAGGGHSYSGTIGRAQYRVEVPERWNGTLVLYSHGYLPPGFPSFGIALTNRPPDRSETERWLLEHGYALAASQFADGGTGYQIHNAPGDQLALLDWFEAHVGKPRRTVATGQSMGATVATLLAERSPDRFDGVATLCGGYDPVGTFNATLDMNFAVRTLLAPGEEIELVRVTDPERSTQALVAAIQRALATPEGRARLALAGAFNNVPGWYTAHQPRPTDPAESIRQQAAWLQNAYVLGLGPGARVDLERKAGGNPSWNVGIDYRRQLARSSQAALVRRAYRAAGLDLRRDLQRLADAPRIAADPDAVAFLRHHVPEGRTPVPVVTLHSTGDGGAVSDQEVWYAEQVRRSGDPRRLRQLYVDRGMHCSFSAAEEIVTLRSLFERIETGRWPDTSPRRLREAADELGAGHQLVLDFGTFQDAPMPAAFTRFHPPRFLRPSR